MWAWELLKKKLSETTLLNEHWAYKHFWPQLMEAALNEVSPSWKISLIAIVEDETNFAGHLLIEKVDHYEESKLIFWVYSDYSGKLPHKSNHWIW